MTAIKQSVKTLLLFLCVMACSGCSPKYIQVPCQKEEPEKLSSEKSCTQQKYDGVLTLEQWAECRSIREVAIETDFKNMREAFRSCK